MSNLNVKLTIEAIDRMTRPMRKMTQDFQAKTERMRESLKKVGEGFDKVGKSISLKVSAPVAAFGLLSLKTAADFEKFKTSLVTATGSLEEAEKAWGKLLNFAATTPFQLEEVLSAFIKLKNMGLDPSNEALTSYGNTASAMGKSLDQMIEAVADAATGEFERLKEFGIKASSQGDKVTFTFKGVKTTVRKEAAEIEKYLQSIGNVDFAGGMDRQSKTLYGLLSTLKDAISQTSATIGESVVKTTKLKERMKALTEWVQKIGEAFTKLPEGVQEGVVYFGIFLAILGPLFIALGQVAIGIAGLVVAFNYLAPVLKATIVLLKTMIVTCLKLATRALVALVGAVRTLSIALLTTPIGWIILGITALAAASYMLVKHWDKVSAFFKNLWDEIKVVFDESVEWVMNRLEPLFRIMDRLKGGLTGIKQSLTDNPVTQFFASEESRASNPKSDPYPSLSAARQAQLDTGGTLRIKIDNEGRASVSEAKPNDRRMNFQTDTGLIMEGF